MNNQKYGIKIAFLVREIYSKLKHCIRNEFEGEELTVPQIMLLKVISKRGKMKVSEISEEMNLTNSTVSGIIDRLERSEIVLRERSKEDRRIVYITLSKKGEEMVKEFRGTINVYFENIFSDLTVEEIDVIMKGLETLKQVVDRKLG
ncbi:MarR family winged helix-turn-helix transcriptional regulator [Brassicibacter mesophilus]|uniref:MarR family winged helix-turn-helix transcriptional regulator n=1 Tax=Brassicibacter mesophilus TaxID=745119 RepID=UPI003D221BB7